MTNGPDETLGGADAGGLGETTQSDPQTRPLSDQDITSTETTGSAPQPAPTDADGTDGDSSDGTDGDSEDADGTDADGTDGTDADGTDGTDGTAL